MRFAVFHWGLYPRVEWTNSYDHHSWAPGVNSTIDDDTGVAFYSNTAYITVSFAAFVPSFSRLALVSLSNASAGGGPIIQLFRIAGNPSDSHKRFYHELSTNWHRYEVLLHLDATQGIQTRVTAGICKISVSGYQVTEVVG
jgi:hypothetical protein